MAYYAGDIGNLVSKGQRAATEDIFETGALATNVPETFAYSPGDIENMLSGGIRSTLSGMAASQGGEMRAVGSLQITGTEEVLRNLSKILATAHDKAIRRLAQNCEKILSESKDEVPWDTTHLLQTGTIEPDAEAQGFRIGFNTPYAAYQHENLSLYHPKPGTKAKYLEDPAMRIAPTIAEDIATALRSELGS